MKRQGWLVGAMLAASAVGGAVSNVLLTARLDAQGAQVVTASQVNVVDGAGRLRAVLSGDDERGLASLAFYDPEGAFRGLVGVGADGRPVLRFTDPAGVTRILATVGPEDGRVTVGDETGGHVRIGFQAGVPGAPPEAGAGPGGRDLPPRARDTPFVALSDGRRLPMQLTLGDRGQPRATLFNRRGQPGIGMVVGADDAPFLSVFDPAGAQRLALGTMEGATLINLGDGAGPRLVLGVAGNGRASVAFHDDEGRIEREVAADTP